ncbi:MAG: ATP-binding cassette domain-containing protein [Eubacteriales bacterium]|nr:ATP-binding cassette domain-containing protein [Eubacteriales bacterium]
MSNYQDDLINFSFRLIEGEVLGIVGLHDSGIQVLVDFLTGLTGLDSGRFYFAGQLLQSGFIKHSLGLGIYCIGNVPQIFPMLSIAENLCVIRAGSNLAKYINYDKINTVAQDILDEFDLDFSPLMKVGQLTRSQQHVLELIKAKMLKAKIVIFSNSLSEYSEGEFYHIYTIIREMQKNGTTFIITESRLERIFELVDRMVLVRNGRNSGTFAKGNFDRQKIHQILMGKKFQNNLSNYSLPLDENILTVKNMQLPPKLYDINFSVRQGEITGFYAIDESDMTPLINVLLGFENHKSGELVLSGQLVQAKQQSKTMLANVGYFGKHSFSRSLFKYMSVKDNIVLGTPEKFATRHGFIKDRIVKYVFKQFFESIGLNFHDLFLPVKLISVESQISLIFSKSYIKGASAILIENPFGGSDLITQQLIMNHILEAQQKHIAVLYFSNNFSEMRMVCNKVYIIRGSTIVGELNHSEMANIDINQIFGMYEI